MTQEEVAESAGVSREWYARLEAGRAQRASPVLLDRLAGTLMMDDGERRALFSFAIPELRKAGPEPARVTAGEIGSLRGLLRRLWSASSPTAIVQAILDDTLDRWRAIDHATLSYRIAFGVWETTNAPLSDRITNAVADIAHRIRTEYSRAEEEEWNLTGTLTQPGDVGFVYELQRRSFLAARMAKTVAQVELGEMSVVAARIRAENGYEANLFLGYEPQHGSFSEMDLAVIAAIAEFASFALSR